jgi:hypothetical protein
MILVDFSILCFVFICVEGSPFVVHEIPGGGELLVIAPQGHASRCGMIVTSEMWFLTANGTILPTQGDLLVNANVETISAVPLFGAGHLWLVVATNDSWLNVASAPADCSTPLGKRADLSVQYSGTKWFGGVGASDGTSATFIGDIMRVGFLVAGGGLQVQQPFSLPSLPLGDARVSLAGLGLGYNFPPNNVLSTVHTSNGSMGILRVSQLGITVERYIENIGHFQSYTDGNTWRGFTLVNPINTTSSHFVLGFIYPASLDVPLTHSFKAPHHF